MSAHVIRLRGFWTAAEAGPGRVRFARSFGRPGTLDAGEAVWLVGGRGPGHVFLNGQTLGLIAAGEPIAFDITSVLQPRNKVEIEVSSGGDSPGDVTLEIRSGFVPSPLRGEG